MQHLGPATLWLAGTLAAVMGPAAASEATGDVQRLQREREQQQMELRLRMQQQQERAIRPAPNPALETQRRGLERDQQQRQQQLHERQSRGAIKPEAQSADLVQREIEQ